MRSFIERYLDDVDSNTNDPSSTVRITKAQKLELLRVVEQQVWERLLTVSGADGSIGQCEASYTLTAGKTFYDLPGNFRQFIRFEHRVGGDRNQVDDVMSSVTHGDRRRGIEILSAQHGFIVHPTFDTTSDSYWTMVYLKGPVLLHHSVAAGVSAMSLKGTPPENESQGEIAPRPDYYKGSLIRVYSAESGFPQTREIVASSPELDFVLKTPWDPIPSGEILYEICPVLPEPYDAIYGMDAAIRILTRRGMVSKRRELLRERSELWNACQNYYLANTADRGIQRNIPYPDNAVLNNNMWDDAYYGLY